MRLTANGRATIEAATPEHVATTRRYVFDQLSEQEQDIVTRLFERLAAGLAD